MAKRLQYTEEDMMKAIDAAREGMSVRKCSMTYNVPRSTLTDKIKGRVPIERKIGPPSVLSAEEEYHLVTWILSQGKAGFPVSKLQLTDSVQILLKELKRENPFPNAGRPGRHWHEAFLRRHPEITSRVSQNLTSQRAIVSEQKIREWFKEVENYMKGPNEEIFSDPRRIFNCDETAIFLNPKREKVLVQKGQKTVYNIVNNDEKECLTTLVVCNAAGELPPPMIMYCYKRIPQHITNKVPNSWGVGRSENGWMTGESFFEYIANIFYPWVQQNKIQFPIALFVDGHISHLTMQLSNFCSEKRITLISLYPNATHILQPLDVAFFHPLKLEWRKVVTEWRIENGGAKFTKEHFAPVLKTAFDRLKDRLPTIIANGFQTCGLFPFNPNNIKFEKFFGVEREHKCNDENSKKSTEEAQKFLIFFEKMNLDKIESFRSSESVWNGKIEDTSLFYFWMTLKDLSSATMEDPENPIYNTSVDVVEENSNRFLSEHDIPSLDISDVTNYDISTNDIDVDAILNAPILFEDELAPITMPVSLSPKCKNGANNIINVNNHSDVKEIMLGDDLVSNTTNEDISEKPTAHEIKCTNDTTNKLMVESVPITNNSGVLNVVEERSVPIATSGDLSDRSPLKDLNYSINQDSNQVNLSIPTPFKRALFWTPSQDKKKDIKRNSKEKIPAVASSAQWQAYHQKKEAKKQLDILEKEEKKQQRLIKQKEREESKNKGKILRKKQKKTEESSPEESSKSDSDVENTNNNLSPIDIGDYVLVKYDNKKFPGLVLNISTTDGGKEYTVKTMTSSGNNWKWPQMEDILNYEEDDVIKHIGRPKQINKRGVYEVPECKV